MELSQDYEDLFKTLNTFKVRYLVVGSVAVAFHARPRYTKDVDVWVPPVLNKPGVVYDALKEFGAPLIGIKPEDFGNDSLVYQIGVEPVRIDVIMGLSGINPVHAWKARKRTKYGNTPINVIGFADLIKSKKLAGRPEDLSDVKALMESKRRGPA